MAKAWRHSRSGIEGLRPHLISGQPGDSTSRPSSASSAKPQSHCAAESDDEVDWRYTMRELGYEGELFLLFEEGPGEL